MKPTMVWTHDWTRISVLINQTCFGFIGRDPKLHDTWGNYLTISIDNMYFNRNLTNSALLGLSGHTQITWLNALRNNKFRSLYVLVHNEHECRVHYEEDFKRVEWITTVSGEITAAMEGVSPVDERTLGSKPVLPRAKLRNLEGDWITFFTGSTEEWAETEKHLDQTLIGRKKKILTLRKTLCPLIL